MTRRHRVASGKDHLVLRMGIPEAARQQAKASAKPPFDVLLDVTAFTATGVLGTSLRLEMVADFPDADKAGKAAEAVVTLKTTLKLLEGGKADPVTGGFRPNLPRLHPCHRPGCSY